MAVYPTCHGPFLIPYVEGKGNDGGTAHAFVILTLKNCNETGRASKAKKNRCWKEMGRSNVAELSCGYPTLPQKTEGSLRQSGRDHDLQRNRARL